MHKGRVRHGRHARHPEPKKFGAMAKQRIIVAAAVPLLLAAVAISSSAAPAPAPAVLFSPARFTLITPALVRLELRKPGSNAWDERPTISYPNGRPSTEQPTLYNKTISGDVITITTAALVLTYDRSASKDGNFTAAALSIALNDGGGSGASGTVWHPNDQVSARRPRFVKLVPRKMVPWS